MRARDRVLALLRLQRRLPASEIASICGINHWTVHVLLARLRREGLVLASREEPRRRLVYRLARGSPLWAVRDRLEGVLQELRMHADGGRDLALAGIVASLEDILDELWAELPSIEAAEHHRDEAIEMWHEERRRLDEALDLLTRSNAIRDEPLLQWIRETRVGINRSLDHYRNLNVVERASYYTGREESLRQVEIKLRERGHGSEQTGMAAVRPAHDEAVDDPGA